MCPSLLLYLWFVLLQENLMLKEQVEALLQENIILKWAVGMQHLKQMVTQYQKQLRTLEVEAHKPEIF